MEGDIAEELEALQSIYSPDDVCVEQASPGEGANVTLKVNKRPAVTFLVSCKFIDHSLKYYMTAYMMLLCSISFFEGSLISEAVSNYAEA